MAPRLYLDNAATSFPKPPCVHEAMTRYATQVGGTAGRGTYFEAREGGRIIRDCRRRICTLINGQNPDHVVFTLNTTDALNLAINGLIQQRLLDHPGQPIHLITTALDHNSVLRPFNAWRENGVTWTCVPCDAATGLVSPDDIRSALRPDTALVTILHASNVTGAIQPVAEIGAACRAAGVPFLVDAAQSLGHIPVDVAAMNIDLLAFPGHKGLLGPLGTGGLYLRPGMEKLVRPVRVGGTGSKSESDTHPTTMPDRYEAGSQNAVGIAGLAAAVEWLLERQSELHTHEQQLRVAMLDGLAELDALNDTPGRFGLHLLGPRSADQRVSVFSLTHESLSPHELAGILEQDYSILTRAGLHCAPRAHAALHTQASGGALRLSFGPFVTLDDVRTTLSALREICSAISEGSAPAPAASGQKPTAKSQ
jgi:cysteine desulfurase family protein